MKYINMLQPRGHILKEINFFREKFDLKYKALSRQCTKEGGEIVNKNLIITSLGAFLKK